MDVPHGIRCARRADRARFIPAARDVPPRTHLRAARHEGHRVQCARDEDRPAGHQLPGGFPSAGGGLVSTIDDYLAFGQMMLSLGKHGNERLLSRPSVEAMTSDQLTPGQKAASGLIPAYFESHGWGFGMAVVKIGRASCRERGWEWEVDGALAE